MVPASDVPDARTDAVVVTEIAQGNRASHKATSAVAAIGPGHTSDPPTGLQPDISHTLDQAGYEAQAPPTDTWVYPASHTA